MDHMGTLDGSSTTRHLLTREQEWKHHLRSSIHPLIFTAVYSIASGTSQLLQLSPAYRADLLITAPKVLQAVFAAFGDYYTWKFAERVYGRSSNQAWAAVRSNLDRPSLEML